MKGEWTEKQAETARQMALEGYSASMISLRVGKTRGAVLGKLWRLGVYKKRPKSERFSHQRSKKKGAPKYNPRATKIRQSAIEPLPGKHRSVESIRDGECRWPFGEAKDATFGFCARPCNKGDIYCPGHMAEAYIKAPVK